jgi:hypothetical protein
MTPPPTEPSKQATSAQTPSSNTLKFSKKQLALAWRITPKILMSAAWEAQVAGREVGVSSALDLTDFSRERARLLSEFEF